MPYGKTITVEKALTVSLTAYTASDVVGGLLTFNLDGNTGELSGTIRRIRLIDDANQKEAYKVYIYQTAPSTIANDAAFAPTVADLKKMIDIVDIEATDYTELNSNAIAIVGGFGDNAMGIDFDSTDGNVYVYLVAVDTPDYAAATDLTMYLDAWVN